MSRGEVTRRLLRQLRPLASSMVVSSLARVGNQGMGVAIPALAAGLVVGLASGYELGGLIALLAGMALVKGALRYVEQFTGHGVAFRLLSELRIDVFRWLVPLAPAGLEDDRSGDLVARVVGDIDRVEPFFAHTIAPLASGLVVPLLTTAGLALWVDPVLALVFLPFPYLIAAAAWIDARRVATLSTMERAASGEAAAIFTDAVQGIREIAVFDALAPVSKRVDEQAQPAAVAGRALAAVAAARSGLSDFLSGAAVAAVAMIGLVRFDAGVVEVGGLAAAIVAAWVGSAPARALESIVPDLEQALAAAARLFELGDRTPPVTAPDDPLPRPGSGRVGFHEVDVSIEGTQVLSEVSLQIDNGSLVGLVGPSGSGKSTLVELLARFRDPKRGMVTIGGVDVSRLHPGELAELVCLVPQRPDIFFGTIADNLRLARPDADEDLLWDVLDRVQLGDWAQSLERGLHTPTGELGGSVSGGQRQRLAIARALLRDPAVLVLDEATSELDVMTECGVLEAIFRDRGLRTVIIVAHRLESVAEADQILVLDRGRLVQRGTHARLVDEDGVYAGLWRRHLDTMSDV